MSNRRKLPAPGLNSDYSGTCIACLKPTDTGLGVRGEAEWHAAFLINLGIPQDEATATVSDGTGLVPDGVYERAYQVCRGCAPAHFPVPALALPGSSLPAVGQPEASA